MMESQNDVVLGNAGGQEMSNYVKICPIFFDVNSAVYDANINEDVLLILPTGTQNQMVS